MDKETMIKVIEIINDMDNHLDGLESDGEFFTREASIESWKAKAIKQLKDL